MPIQVAIVDDQHLVRTGFALVINSQPDMQVAWEAGDGHQALRLLSSHPVDVLLMDVRMPSLDGLATTEALTTRLKDGDEAPKVIILTTFDLDDYIVRAIKAGASGFLLKDSPPEHILDAIRTVHQGDAVIAPSSTRKLLSHIAHFLPEEERASTQILDALTQREKDVLVAMAQGMSNSEIAHELTVAETTIKTHVSRILTKLGARDRVQAVVIAYETGLVTPQQ